MKKDENCALLTSEVSKFLTSKKVKFDRNDDDYYCPIFTFYVGEAEGGITISYPNDIEIGDDEFISLNIYSKIDDTGNSFFYESLEYEKMEDVEYHIENLLAYLKDLSRVLKKVEEKIEQIKDICDGIGLDYDSFITVNYDF